MTFSDNGPEFEIVTDEDLNIYLWEGRPVTEQYIPPFNENDFYSCREITSWPELEQEQNNPDSIISAKFIEQWLKIKEGFKF